MKRRRGKLNKGVFDPAARAAAELNAALKEEDIVIARTPDAAGGSTVPPTDDAAAASRIPISQARAAPPVLSPEQYVPEGLRLLLFCQDDAIARQGSAADIHLREIAGLFGEVHVIVMRRGKRRRRDTERRGDNLWIYYTSAATWWLSIFNARRLALDELGFARHFHADLIVAYDPFEAGAAALLTARKFNRPLLVHVRDDLFSRQFVKRQEDNEWRRLIARYVLPRATCARTNSTYLRNRLVEAYPDKEATIETLPVYYRLDAWRDAHAPFSLKERYPQFTFTVVHLSAFDEQSHTDIAIEGVAPLFRRYPRVGMFVLGEGKRRRGIEKRVAALGIEAQVVFEDIPSDLTPYMKGANVFLHTSEAPDHEEYLLHAAAAGAPIVSLVEGLAGELFIDDNSALLCPLDSPPCFAQKINKLLNENVLRKSISLNARDTVFERIEQDYGSYLASYKASIERCLENSTKKEKEAQQAADT